MEGSHLVGPEAYTPDEVVRAGFGEERVASVHKLLKKGWSRIFSEVDLENDVVAISFEKSLAEIGGGASKVYLYCAGSGEAMRIR